MQPGISPHFTPMSLDGYAPVTVSCDVRMTRGQCTRTRVASAEAEEMLVQHGEAMLMCVGLGRPSHGAV